MRGKHSRLGTKDGLGRRVLLVAALWIAATAFGLAFAAYTRVGPIVATLGGGHGVHVGDLLALFFAYTAAALLTRRLSRRRP